MARLHRGQVGLRAPMGALLGVLAALSACDSKGAPPLTPVPVPPADGTAPPVPLASVAAPAIESPTFRAVVSVTQSEDVMAAVPLLCHDASESNGWLSDRDTCVERLRGASIVHAEGSYAATSDVVTIFDRDYRGVVVPEDAGYGLAFVGMDAIPEERCRVIETEPPALDALMLRLVDEAPVLRPFAGAYPDAARRSSFTGDFDGDGSDEVMHSITLDIAAGRLDLVVRESSAGPVSLGYEWSVGDDFGGAPEHRLVDVRSLRCFAIDDEPGLEIVASLRGETEREQVAGSFRNGALVHVGHSLFFGD